MDISNKYDLLCRLFDHVDYFVLLLFLIIL